MPALQVRDFPEDLYEQLKEYAALNHRSIAQQTIACVEAELARHRNASVFEFPDPYDIPIPANVREAALRARPVNPWTEDEVYEPEEVVEARRKKREKLFAEIDELRGAWKGPLPTGDEIAALIREMREERDATLTGNLGITGKVAGEERR